MKKSMFIIISLFAMVISSCTNTKDKENNLNTPKVVDVQPTVHTAKFTLPTGEIITVTDTVDQVILSNWQEDTDNAECSSKDDPRCERTVSADLKKNGKIIAAYSVKRCYQPVANWEPMESWVRPARYYDKGIHPYDIIYRGDKKTIILTILFPEKELAKDWIL